MDEIASEVQARYGYSRRAAYRHAVGWTLDEAAERYNHAADDAQVRLSGPRLSEWENWPRTADRRPTAFNLLILAKLYGTHPTQLITDAEKQHLDHRERTLLHNLNQPGPGAGQSAATHARTRSPEPETLPANTGLDVPWTAAGSLRLLHLMTDSETMKPIGRRLFLTLTGAAATAPAHEWLIAQPAENVARSGNMTLPPGVVDDLDMIIDGLRRMDDQLGGAALVHLLRSHLRSLVELIRNRRYDDNVGRRLHANAAELLRLTGWACLDAGLHADAQRYWLAALHVAHAAGDRALGANVLGVMSSQARELGQIRESVTLAETARAGYTGATPKVSAILDLWAAEAHAAAHEHNECRRLIDAAFQRLGDAAPSSGEPGWAYWLDDTTAHSFAGHCYLHLGDWPRARAHLHQALTLQDATQLRDGALRRLRLADTYLSQNTPDIEHALALGTQAVNTLTDTIRSNLCVTRLRQVVGHLASHRQLPAVREFTDRAAALFAAS